MIRKLFIIVSDFPHDPTFGTTTGLQDPFRFIYLGQGFIFFSNPRHLRLGWSATLLLHLLLLHGLAGSRSGFERLYPIYHQSIGLPCECSQASPHRPMTVRPCNPSCIPCTIIPPALVAGWFSEPDLLTTPTSPSGRGLPLPLPPPRGSGPVGPRGVRISNCDFLAILLPFFFSSFFRYHF